MDSSDRVPVSAAATGRVRHRGRRSGRPLPNTAPPALPVLAAFATLAALALVACEGGGSAGVSPPGLSLPMPTSVLQSRTIDRNALVPRVTIDGTPVGLVRNGGSWTLETIVPRGQVVEMRVDWLETFEGRELPLATWSGRFGPFVDDVRDTIGPARYDTSFDEDGDGLTNLQERERGSDPGNVNDPGATTPVESSPAGTLASPTRIPFVDVPEGGISVDGRYSEEALWRQASYHSVTNLLIDADGVLDPRVPDYKWAGLHDGRALYLFVLFEEDGRHTPFDDSPSEPLLALRDDDALNLFFDVDLSRGATFDVAADDRYLVIPLPATNAVVRPPVSYPFGTTPLPNLAYGVCACTDPGGVAGWEIRIPFEDLGLVPGQPFGFELQFDQDLDGGARDEVWSWSYPPLYEPPDGLGFESPSLFGVAVLSVP